MKNLGRIGLVVGALALGNTVGCTKEPEPALVHRVKGSDHLSKNEYAEAIAAYDLSLQADPNQEKVLEKKAFAQMKLGKTEDAVATLLKTADFKSTPADKLDVYRTAAGIFMQAGKLDQAEQTYLQALKLEPKDEISLGWLAEIYSQRGGARSMAAPVVPEHLDKALDYYNQVLAINPNSSATYLNMRVIMGRFMENAKQQKQVAELEALENMKKDKIKAKEAEERATQLQAKIDEYMARFQEFSQKFSEAKKAEAAKAAEAAAAKPAEAKK